eukprot:3586238-Rhodomonas_salina.1
MLGAVRVCGAEKAFRAMRRGELTQGVPVQVYLEEEHNQSIASVVPEEEEPQKEAAPQKEKKADKAPKKKEKGKREEGAKDGEGSKEGRGKKSKPEKELGGAGT